MSTDLFTVSALDDVTISLRRETCGTGTRRRRIAIGNVDLRDVLPTRRKSVRELLDATVGMRVILKTRSLSVRLPFSYWPNRVRGA